jgi:hypothetical protein
MSYLNCRHLPRPSTDAFDADTSGAGKQIQHVYPLKIYTVVEQIK